MTWDVDRQIKYLPAEIAVVFAEEAKRLYSDLLENRLNVVLVPAQRERYEGHMIRAVESRNPHWYRELYQATPHLKRTRTLKSLERIAQARDLPFRDQRGAVAPYGSYDTRYRDFIRQRLVEGYEVNGMFIPEEPVIRKFFSVKEEKKEKNQF